MRLSRKNSISVFIFFILSTLLFFSCGTKAVQIQVHRPAEINLKKYAKVAMGDITNAKGRKDAHAKDVSDSITSAFFETGYFEVLDRQHLQNIIEEHNLKLSGLLDADSAPELGRIIGTSALVYGRIQTDKYDEERSSSDTWKDSKGKSHKTHYRKGVYTLAVSIKILDIETSQIVATKNLQASYKNKTRKTDGTAPKIDDNALYTSCLNRIKADLKKLIAPYKKMVEANFQTDSKLPETESALNQFKIDEWDTGVSLLEDAASKPGLEPKVQAKAYYNLGLAQMYSGQFDEAIENFKKAMILNPKEDRYVDAVKTAKKEQVMADKLEMQQRDN